LGHARAGSAGLVQVGLLQIALSRAALEQAALASTGFPLGRDGAGLASFGCYGSPFLRYKSDLIFSLVIWLIWCKKGQLKYQ
jgi:hypothetical protein